VGLSKISDETFDQSPLALLVATLTKILIAMNFRLFYAVLAAVSTFAVSALEINYSNKGTDGAFNPTGASYVLDLSQAATRAWDAAPLAAGNGVYDTNKWAVVFKFSSISIPAGTTVTFKNHASRAPVVWLVDGNVEIAGSINLNGESGDSDPNRIRFSEPGPGGFRGGDAHIVGSQPTSGFGPGGGVGFWEGVGHRWAAFGTEGYADGSYSVIRAYGNPSLIPLIGGSGGGFDVRSHAYGGGAGGGAMLLAVKGNCLLSGTVTANGGGGPSGYANGTGGAIRIVCESTSGNGILQALSSSYATHGRIRFECSNPVGFSFQPSTFPVAPSNPVQIWPESASPTARIVSVNALNAPSDPRSSLTSLAPADLRLPAGSRTNVVNIETFNLPATAVVTLRVVSTPNGGVDRGDLRVNADYVSTDAGNPNRHLWRKEVVIEPGYHALQVVARAQ